MERLKKLWAKWWFFIPVSLILVFIISIIIGLLFNLNPKNLARLMWLVWIWIVLNRYWWNRKKK